MKHLSAFEAVIPDCIDPIIHDIRLNALSLVAEEVMREKMKIAKSTRDDGNPSRRSLTSKEFQKTRGCDHTCSSNPYFLLVFRRSICNLMKILHSESLSVPFEKQIGTLRIPWRGFHNSQLNIGVSVVPSTTFTGDLGKFVGNIGV